MMEISDNWIPSPVLWIVILGDIDPLIDKITRLEALSPPLTH